MKKPLLILAGPTAIGKTDLSLRLAEKLKGSIISADSMQIYRHMDIGSAKIKPSEMQNIPHYLIDELDPWEEFNVLRFQQMAKTALQEIYQAKRLPIVVGGTGFYIQALLYDIDFTKENTDITYRTSLESLDNETLHTMLTDTDPQSAKEIHANNRKRTIRALEYHHLSGEKISDHNAKERQKESPYDYSYFVLTEERNHLYERINQRVDTMLDQGLIKEVQKLKEMGCTRDMVSMQGLGYKEILAYLEERCTLEEAIYLIKRNTRHFAKRQLTWFRRERNITWIEKDDFNYDDNKILDHITFLSKTQG
jgi:tRNA dimethylallyltransferase